uniref:ADAMTS/ADAMTS-like Spacer 1 domain-containing protein n=1 Tax=Trichogramma kaykai TaxID=54128 RepID=A0ABD2XL01_9HYME
MSSVYFVLLLLIWSSVDATEQIEARFSKKLGQPGYYLITTIPEGATRINVTESLDTQNYLAIRKQNGKYLFNGPGQGIMSSGAFHQSNTTIVYLRRAAYRPENFYASGPLNESLDVMLLYNKGMPDVFYQYELPVTFDIPTTRSYRTKGTTKSMTLPRPRTTQAVSTFLDNAMLRDQTRSSTRGPFRKKRRYDWKSFGYSDCSKPCGGGVRKKIVICVRLRSTRHVENTRCDPARKPLVKILKCNSVPCRPSWELGPWSECSVSCGNGTRSRRPICRQVISDTVSITVNDSLCPAPAKADLVAPTEICLMTDCSKYSTTTAPTTIISVVEPLVLQSSSNIVTTKRFVSKTKTSELSRWKVGDWSQCSKSCGSGSVRTRLVTCITGASSSGAVDCDPAERPASEEKCGVEACDKETPNGNELPSAGVAASASSASGSWLYSDWPELCSAECGVGIVHRRLYCESSSKELCDESKMPEFNKTCYGGSSQCGGQWFVGPWTKCSSSCDTGIQTRDVVCVSRSLGKSKIFENENCPPDSKPNTMQTCQGPPCKATWFVSDWTECSQSCGGGVQRREVKCIVPDGVPTNETQQLECDANERPIGERSCNATACGDNPIAPVNETKKNSTDSVNEKQPIAEKVCRDVLPDCAKIMQMKSTEKPCKQSAYRVGCCLTCRQKRLMHQIKVANRKSNGSVKNSLE